MISLLTKSSQLQQFIKGNSFLSLKGKNNNPIYSFSSSTKEFNEMLKKVEEQNISLGKSQFRQLYFPIKRIHFDNNVLFQKIFQNPKNTLKSVKRQTRLMRFFYHIPFFAYYLNYLFFLPPDSITNQVILASLFVSANVKSIFDSFQYSREITELYINNDAQKFIAVLPKLIVSSNINELKGKLKGSVFEANECQGFQFTLDDIEQVTLLSNDKDKIKNQLNDRMENKKTGADASSQKINQAEQKKQILEKLSKIEENEEGLIITIAKDEWNCSRTFRLSLSQNELTQFNDYMVALGYKQRIVMRESMAPNNKEQPKQETTTSSKQDKNTDQEQNESQTTSNSTSQ